MTDIVDRATRSCMMSRIRGRDTIPERTVRSFLHRAGLRFRLHVRGLPGTPDIVLPKYRCAIQVHGCFWHRHGGCPFAYTPKSNATFWTDKFGANVRRDRITARHLAAEGWRLIVVWECQVAQPRVLVDVVKRVRSSLR